MKKEFRVNITPSISHQNIMAFEDYFSANSKETQTASFTLMRIRSVIKSHFIFFKHFSRISGIPNEPADVLKIKVVPWLLKFSEQS
jgi:hypothetical protein